MSNNSLQQCFWERCRYLARSTGVCWSQRPQSDILMTAGVGVGGEGPTEASSYFIPPQNHYFFQHTPKNLTPAVNCAYAFVDLSWWKLQFPQKSLFFFATPKNSRVFHRPQKIPFGQNFRPKEIPRWTPLPDSKILSEAPGAIVFKGELHP